MKNPIKVIKYNIEGTARVLNECRKHKIKRFICKQHILNSQEGSFYRFGKKRLKTILWNILNNII